MPGYARKDIAPQGEVGIYHCTHRCVRRALLCGRDPVTGKDFDYRRGWVHDRLRALAQVFCVEIGSYAVMSNHLHVEVRTRPDVAAVLTDKQVAQRWLSLSPRRLETIAQPTQAAVEQLCKNKARIATCRDRLGSLSWFMQYLAEPIARCANKEDGVTGRFWEGRFDSKRLLDPGAVLTGAVYIDLNPIRAAMAETPEASDHTSVQDRIVARQAIAKRRRVEDLLPEQRASVGLDVFDELERDAKRADWLSPLGEPGGMIPGVAPDKYLELVEWTGRQLREGKRGSIPDSLRPILERLELDVENWLESVTHFGRWFRRVVGTAENIVLAAAKAGMRWFHGRVAAARMYARPT